MFSTQSLNGYHVSRLGDYCSLQCSRSHFAILLSLEKRKMIMEEGI